MKGFWRIVESVMAVIIVMGFLVSAGSVYFSRTDPQELVPAGYERLKDLDARGLLRPLASNGDYDGISALIDVPGYSHAVLICGFDGVCGGNYTQGSNVAVSTYIIAGYVSYGPKEIRLYMWR
jgi:hypothetical protein